MSDYIFYVKVANSKFVLDSVSQATIALGHGITYRFDQSDSSNSGHPLVFSTTSDGTHNSGSAYTTGVTTTGTAGSSGAYVDIAVTSSTPASLYYYCSNHSGMGSAVITTGNTHVTTNNLGLLLPILANADDQWGSHINQSLRKIEDTFGANADVYTYNITGDTTASTGSATAGGTLAFSAGQHLEVYLNGVKLVGNLSSGNDYTVNASTNTITLASNAINGDVVNVVVFKTFQFADAVPATGGTFSGNVAYTGNIQVDDIVEKTSAHGVEIEGVLLKDSIVQADDIQEKTSAHGVEIDGVTLKDGGGTFTGEVTVTNKLNSSAGNSLTLQSPTGGAVIVNTNGANERVRVTSAGNVGIGASPTDQGSNRTNLHIHSPSSQYSYISMTNSTSGLDATANGQLLISDGNVLKILNRESGGDINFENTGTGNVNVATGNLVIGTAGKGIDFSANTDDEIGAGSIATNGEILNDYEHGSWNPVLSDGSSDGDHTMHSDTAGTYTKIGDVVHITAMVRSGDLSGDTISGTNACSIKGLPFTIGTGTKSRGGIAIGYYNLYGLDESGGPMGAFWEGETYIQLYESGGNTGGTLSCVDFHGGASGFYVTFSATYHTD